MDYPAPDSVPDDLFAFRPPPDVTIEINDPDLGRQVYSEPRSGAQTHQETSMNAISDPVERSPSPDSRCWPP